MTYNATSPIAGSGSASANQIDAFMAALGRQLAPRYAPDGAYRPPPPIGATLVSLCREAGLNQDLVSAQIGKESAGWQSRIVRDKNNPSGLGAVNDNAYDGAATFDTPADGIKATIAHLLTYMDGSKNPWAAFDPRYQVTIASKAIAGHIVRLNQLDGNWAVPGVGYGAGIAELANELLATARLEEPVSKLRIIVTAGHEHIGQITSEKIGASSASRLKGSTGALGREAEWTAPWADALVTLLQGYGVEAVRGDSIYSAAVYGADANLVICGHCDGVGSTKPTGMAQHCMASPVLSGIESGAADAEAARITQIWYQVYPEMVQIPGNGPITDDMQWYYGGWYRSANTPMILVEHGILGDGGTWRQDLPSPAVAAAADCQALVVAFGLTKSGQPARDPNSRHFPETDLWMVNLADAPILAWYEANGDIEEHGLPLEGMHLDQDPDGTEVYRQLTENTLIECYPGGFGPYAGPYVRRGGLGQRYLAVQKQLAAKTSDAAD